MAHANRVPKVPGAQGASPLPQPQARKWAGWAKRNLRLGAPRDFSGKVIEPLVIELDGLIVRVENGDLARRAVDHLANAPER